MFLRKITKKGNQLKGRIFFEQDNLNCLYQKDL